MTRWTAALLVLLAAWTASGHIYGRVWQSNPLLWAYVARVQPYNMWVQQNYGTALVEAKATTTLCEQLSYVQRLATSPRVQAADRSDPIDTYVVDRLMALAYFDYQERGSSECRDDSILSPDSH